MHGVDAPPRLSAPAVSVTRHRIRPEIQALRAVAVAGVVLYHLWPGGLRGGFVGVDVFFVISGFLITQQLADELAATGRISLARFWARRIRRILPAAFAVLLACVAIVVLVLPRVAWSNNLGDIRAAAAYVENWQLGLHSVDYLAAENAPSLVQHYWSLSVEEQFYLAWPLLLILAVTLAGRVRRARVRGWLVLVLAVTAAASFGCSVVWTAADPAMAFFATPTRAWEFAVGGLAGLLVPAAPRSSTAAIRAVASWVGLVIVLCSMLAIPASAAFPGAIALVPVAGAVLVVAAELDATPRWSPAGLINPVPVQWLGDNSYSTYLWHWPLLIAAPWVAHGHVPWGGKLLVLAASLLLAAGTKRFVEDPVRTGAVWRSRTWLAYALAGSGVAGLVAVSSNLSVEAQQSVQRTETAARQVATARTHALLVSPHRSCYAAAAMDPSNRCPKPYARPRKLDTAFAAADGRSDPCLQKFDASTPVPCTVGRRVRPTRTIAIVGNSHAWRLVPTLALLGEQRGWRVVVMTRIDCLGLTTAPVGTGGVSANCLRWSANVQRRLLAMPHLDAVIFPSYRFGKDYTAGQNATAGEVSAAQRQVVATWARLHARGTRVVVTEDVPGMRPTPDPECIAASRAAYDPCAVDQGKVVKPNLTSVLAQRHPALATYLPLASFFCDTRRCHGLIGGVVVYFDSHHLTTTYARSLARYLGRDLAPLLGAPHGSAGR